MLSPLQWWAGPWEKVRGQLHLDLDHIVAAINQRWSVTFGDNNLLQAGTIEGDPTPATRYVANTGTKTPHGPKWDFVNLINGVINRLAFKNLAAASAASVLLGRGSAAGGGDFQEITLGTGLVMTGTVLSSTGGSSGGASGVAFSLLDSSDPEPALMIPGAQGPQGNTGPPGGGGIVLQVLTSQSVTYVTGTGSAIPIDDTIPQSTEGDQYFSITITPGNASNRLLIEAALNLAASNVNAWFTLALFQDSGTGAIAASTQFLPTSGGIVAATLRFIMAAGTTSATTFKLRAGVQSGDTPAYMNGNSSGRFLGGVMVSGMSVTEITP